jgi:hypothetical protein
MNNHLSRSSFTLAATCVVWMYATPLIAEKGYTAEYIQVFMQHCDSSVPGTVRVVLYDEGNVRDLTRMTDLDGWQIKTESFDLTDRVVSLRDERRRTGCAKATPKATREGAYPYLARYVFECDQFMDTWLTLAISNDANLPVNTFRYFPGDVPCEEPSRGELEFVAWEKETVYVQFGNPGKRPYQYYDLMIQDGAIQRKSIQQGESVVTRGEVLQQLTVRGGRGTGNAASIRAELNLDKSIKTVKVKVR